MKKMKKVLLLFAVVLSLGAMVGCTDIESGTKEIASAESEYTADLMKQINDEIGMPEITEFYEKKLAKEVLELRDDSKLVCYAYTYSPYTGKFIYLGKSIGYGIPYSTQYTNPEVMRTGGNSSGYWGATIKQADPNGLYSGDGLSATWLQMIDEETGSASVFYYEPTIVVSQTKMPKRLVEDFSIEGIDY